MRNEFVLIKFNVSNSPVIMLIQSLNDKANMDGWLMPNIRFAKAVDTGGQLRWSKFILGHKR